MMGISLEEWRRQQVEGDEGELPVSGLTVRLRRVGMMELLERGDVPVTLRPLLMKAAAGDMAKAGAGDLEEYGKVMTLVAGACLVWPEGLKVEELPFGDRVAIALWANEGAQKLRPFRAKSAGNVDAA